MNIGEGSSIWGGERGGGYTILNTGGVRRGSVHIGEGLLNIGGGGGGGGGGNSPYKEGFLERGIHSSMSFQPIGAFSTHELK